MFVTRESSWGPFTKADQCSGVLSRARCGCHVTTADVDWFYWRAFAGVPASSALRVTGMYQLPSTEKCSTYVE